MRNQFAQKVDNVIEVADSCQMKTRFTFRLIICSTDDRNFDRQTKSYFQIAGESVNRNVAGLRTITPDMCFWSLVYSVRQK